jgi:RNA polymerase sigma factor (sigma-70 family)
VVTGNYNYCKMKFFIFTCNRRASFARHINQSQRQMDEDVNLVRLVRTGHKPAFKQLVERYEDYVFTITFKVLKSREEAEEAAQDAFLKAYQNLEGFEEKSRFSTWLYTIAYRAAIDMARKKRLPANSIDDDASFLQLEDEVFATPVEQMQDEDLQAQLAVAIDKLKPDDAAMITLFYLQEMSVKEIAEIMNLTITNVKTRLHRLREALREILSRQLKQEIQDLL